MFLFAFLPSDVITLPRSLHLHLCCHLYNTAEKNNPSSFKTQDACFCKYHYSGHIKLVRKICTGFAARVTFPQK